MHVERKLASEERRQEVADANALGPDVYSGAADLRVLERDSPPRVARGAREVDMGAAVPQCVHHAPHQVAPDGRKRWKHCEHRHDRHHDTGGEKGSAA